MTDISAWTAIDDNNLNPSPAGWPEGMMPSGVNNSARAMMGSLKRWRDQAQPTIHATGTANALVLTYPVPPAALLVGDVFSFLVDAPNTGPATLQINAQAAHPITSSLGTALVGGELTAAGYINVIQVAFDGSTFRLTGPPSIVPVSSGGTGATTPAGAAAAINAVARAGDTMTGNLTAPGIHVTNNVIVDGPLSVGGTAATGSLTVTGNISVSGQLSTVGIQYPAMGLSAPATNIGFGYSYTNGSLWVQANGGSVGYLIPTPSDERLKRDIRPISVDPLAALCRVGLKAFNQVSARNDPDDGVRHRDVGFIAQQLREIVPDAVIEPPEGMVDGYLGLDLMPLVAYCVGAIQLLAKRVDELETALVK